MIILPLSPEYVPFLFTSSPTDRRSQLCDDSLNAFRHPGHYPHFHITDKVRSTGIWSEEAIEGLVVRTHLVEYPFEENVKDATPYKHDVS